MLQAERNGCRLNLEIYILYFFAILIFLPFFLLFCHSPNDIFELNMGVRQGGPETELNTQPQNKS